MKKRHLLLPFTLSAAACLTAGVLPVFAANTSASSFTVEDAKAAAESCLPSGSTFLRSETDDREYDLKYYNESLKELYELEVNRLTGKVTKLESQKTDHRGGTEIKLSQTDIEDLISKQYDNYQSLSTKLDRDDGYYIYEVSLISGDQKIELEIHPGTGEILEREIHYNYTAPETLSQNTSVISYEKAGTLALKQVPDATITDIELEKENGVLVYEIELYKDGHEYDLILNAATGEKLFLASHQDSWNENGYSFDWDHHSDRHSSHSSSGSNDKQNSQTSLTPSISMEQAQKLLLEKVPGATIKELELDTDKGRLIYEGELRKGKMEYEFEMDANTGAFLEWEEEYDD